ncbi:hypothetical protein AeRB84_013144 [Aphanomyces euteiches]|nr:hypothetical protein AeRB84_013144 [Aphanomyces euteiches]
MEPPEESTKPIGVTLAFVHAFVEHQGGRDAFEKLTTADVCSSFVLPFTNSTKLSLVDHVAQDPTYGSDYVRPAQWFISHAWTYQFLDVIDALDYFFTENGLADTTAFWFCMFNNNQHEIQDNQRDSSYWFDIFYSSLTSIGNVVMVLSPWNNPETLTRMWCVFEVYASIMANARFEVALGKMQKEEFLKEIVQQDNAFFRMLARIKSETSETKVEADREFIEAKIRADIGFSRLDRMVFEVMESWIFRTLETQSNLPTNAPAMQAKYLEALGSIHLNARRYPQAKEHFTRANDIWHQENTPDKWRSQSEVAIAMAVCQEPRSEWEPLFQEALEHQEIELGSDHRDTAITLGYYGVALGEYNEYSRATELIKRAYESQQKTSANDVMMAIDCCLNIGKMCMFQSNYIEAAKWLEQGYEQSCLVFGPDYKSSLMLRNHLAIVYGVHSRYEDCLNMLLESYNSSVRTFGPDHIDTWQVLSKSVTVYCSLGQYDQMERVLLQCREKFKATEGLDTQWYLKCERDLGKLYYFREEYERAAPLIEMAYRELFAKKNFLVFHTIYDLYHLKLKTHGLDTLEDLAAYEKILEDSSCTDETWKAHPCRGCFVLVRGRRFVCAECPTDSRWYCAPCVADKKFTAFCPHDSWEVFVPPQRYIHEQRLRLLSRASAWEKYDAAFETYQAYCNKHNIDDRQERIQPSSKIIPCCVVS